MTDKEIFEAIRARRGSPLTQEHVSAINAIMYPDSAMPRRIGPKGLAIIKQFEGLRLKAYLCPAGVLTIGYGHTGPDVKRDMVITEAQADALLVRDCARFEAAVAKLAPVTTQEQFDALVSFAFNLGESALAKSTLLKKHNAGDYAGAAAEFAKWNKAGGKVLTGLVRRRAAEAQLYRSGS